MRRQAAEPTGSDLVATVDCHKKFSLYAPEETARRHASPRMRRRRDTAGPTLSEGLSSSAIHIIPFHFPAFFAFLKSHGGIGFLSIQNPSFATRAADATRRTAGGVLKSGFTAVPQGTTICHTFGCYINSALSISLYRPRWSPSTISSLVPHCANSSPLALKRI